MLHVSVLVCTCTLSGAGSSLLRCRLAERTMQVPCGIYDDEMRVRRLNEDAATIMKAVKQISELSSFDSMSPLSYNQLVRWVNTKEQHATHIITEIAEYFLTQRVVEKGGEDSCERLRLQDEGECEPMICVSCFDPQLCDEYREYQRTLVIHHRVMRAAMKCKQTADEEAVEVLQEALHDLGHLYVHHEG